MRRARAIRFGSVAALLAAAAVLATAAGFQATPAAGANYTQISGAGSTWSANAIQQWTADVQQFGMQVNYAPTGSSDGRNQFLQGTVDFAASDIPFQSHPDDGSQVENPAPGSYAYIPVTSGGTVFAYNLVVNGQRVTNLRLSGQNIAKIFTGAITNWDDPALAADNPQLTLPNRAIVPVVRSDGSGSTAQFSLWMIAQYPDLWNALCQKSGRAPACGETSFFPNITGMIAQNADLGVMGYVSQNYAQGAIGYVEFSYALNAHFPVVKMLNAAGYYTEPTPDNVAVSLLKAEVDTTDTSDPSLYLTQKLGNVYTDPDPRTYPLSSYSYMILPTQIGANSQFTTSKGHTLADFLYYAMCQGQQESASLGYSPMPVNLVTASFAQITKIPGAVTQSINIQSCNNPTFSAGSPNKLADQAPQPQACDKQGSVQCATGTGGDTNPTTLNGGSRSGGTTSTVTTPTVTTPSGSTSSGSTSSGATSSGTRAPTTAGSTVRGGTSSTPASSAGSGSSTAGTSAACDPSTQNCGTGSGSTAPGALAQTGSGPSADATGGSPGGNGSTVAAVASTTVLAPRSRWTSMYLTLLLVVLVMVLVLAPGATALILAHRRR